VTGGAGFIGSHLCRRLVAEGNDVLCVDNFYTGSRDNVADLLGNPRFELLRHDVTFPLYVEADEIYKPCLPGVARPLPERSRTDDQDLGARRNQHVGIGKALARQDSPGLHQRSLW
jgi:GDP-mannose 4,6 dehydratase